MRHLQILPEFGRTAAQHAHRPAIVERAETVTYGALFDRAQRFATWLRERGVGAGDVVTLSVPNGSAWVVCYLGILHVGAIPAALNPRDVPTATARSLRECQPRLWVTTSELAAHTQTDVAAPGQTLCVDTPLFERTVRAHPSAPFSPARRSPDDPAVIVFTSGTTRVPLGVTLTHGNLVFTWEAKRRYLRLTADDRLLLFLPLFHCFGQNAILGPALLTGASVLVHDGFQVEHIRQSIRDAQATVLFGVPETFRRLLEAQVAPSELASVRLCFSAAAPLSRDVEDRWQQAYSQPIYQGYGLTESSPFASFNHASQHRPGSVGTAIEEVRIQVLGDDDTPLPAGEIGEVVIQGPNVMHGYWRRPQETARVCRGGWLHTGDLGHVDADGYLYLHGRRDDVINVNGFKVHPIEIEEVLLTHPLVGDAAVYGGTDERMGVVLTGVVVTKSAASLDEADLRAHCRTHLAGYKVPAVFRFVETLPRTTSGKLIRRLLITNARRSQI